MYIKRKLPLIFLMIFGIVTSNHAQDKRKETILKIDSTSKKTHYCPFKQLRILSSGNKL